MLQLLQFEVGVHRDDPSTRVWLQRAAETEGLTAENIDWMGVICLEQRTRGPHRPAWPLLQQRPCACPAALTKGSGHVLGGGLAAGQPCRGLSASFFSLRREVTSPRVQATRQKPELGRLAFELALKRRQAEVPKDYDQIAWLLRQLISTCTHHTRHEAKRYFEAARDELERFLPANCPMGEDELHWYAADTSSRPYARHIP